MAKLRTVAFSPFGEMQKAVADSLLAYRLVDPLAQMRKELFDSASFLREFNRSLLSQQADMRHALKQVNQSAYALGAIGIKDSLQALRETTIAPFLELQRSAFKPSYLDELADVRETLREAMSDAVSFSQAPDTSDMLRGVNVQPLLDQFRDSFQAIVDLSSTLNIQDIVADEHSTSVAGDQVTNEEIRAALSAFVEEATEEGKSGDLSELVGEVLHWLRKFEGTTRQVLSFILLHLLLPLLVGLPGNYLFHEHASSRESQARVAVRRHIEEGVRSLPVPVHTLDRYRWVTKQDLKVRAKRARRSGLLARLSLGTIVEVEQQRRSWTQIEWFDSEAQAMKRGWVFSRYVKRLERPIQRKRRKLSE